MRLRRGMVFAGLLAAAALVLGHPFAPFWQNGTGPAVHYQPVSWPSEPANAANCGATCGDWKPYTRFRNSLNDPRVQDPSNGGTAPQNYVNVASSCTDKNQPSIYYYLHKDPVDPDKDVLMFRWRVEQAANNYATGPSAGNYSSSNPWSSALWTVLFDVDGSGYRTLAAHLNGSSGSPAEAIDNLAGIWGETPSQSLDYFNDPKVHLLGHNPTGLVGATNKILNFQDSLTPTESWPNGAGETTWDYGTTRAKKVSTSPCTEYFIDYQIPVAMLDASGVGGPKITRDTPIAMLFCTANSLTNPFQKDCAINKSWAADGTRPAPFGDYLSFNKTEPYQQPIVSSVTATPPNTCPGTYKLTAKVQDALALNNGVVGPSVKAVDFYFWYDRDGDGDATAADVGSVWTKITPTAALASQSLNTWTANWNAASLPKGKYLIGVQAVDDSTAVDDEMTPTGVDNRTFSYLSGNADNEIYIAGVWEAGQQAAFPGHSPVQAPASSENWFGNPSVTGNQVALVGTAINTCGLAPAITLGATPTSVAAGGTVAFTVTIENPAGNSSALDIDELRATLPSGFAYVNGTSSGTTAANPTVNGQQLTWTLGAPVSVAAGASTALSFSATAGSTAGTYNAAAAADTSFGSLTSAPTAIVVGAARLSLASSPSAYSVPADGTTPLTFTLAYANDSAFVVTSAAIGAGVPAGATYVSCSGAVSCAPSGANVNFSLGSLSANASGTVSYTISVPNSWLTASLTSGATFSATAPDGNTVSANASSTVAVTGLAGSGSSAAFRLSKTANVVNIAPAGSVTFTLSYENYGGASASGVVLTDTLPSGFTYNSCSNSCSHNSGVVTWNIGTVAAGATGSLTVTVDVANPFTAPNPAVNNASMAWTGGGPVSTSASVGVTGQACSVYYFRDTTNNVGFDGVQRIATVSPVPVSGDTGAKVTATAPVSGAAFLEVLRLYQDPRTANDVPFNGNITTNMYIDRANGQGLNIRATVYDYNSVTGAKTQLAQNTTLFNGSTKGLLTFAVTPSGTLAKDHRLLWVYEARSNHNSQTVQVEFQFAGTTTNGISGGTTFANSNAQYCVTPPANLTLSNSVDTASVAENTTPKLTYALRYANAGSATANNLSLVGALPTGFTNCEYSTDGSSWSACSNAGAAPPSHTFSIASLTGGSSGTVYVRGNVPANTSGPATLTATSTLASDQTSQISAAASTAVTGSSNSGTPALTLSLSANRTTVAPGQNVIYTVTVINTGDAAASNVVVSDAVPAAAYYTYASCTGGCANGAGTLTWPTITTLAAGASQSYTYTMTAATSGVPAGVTVIADDASASGDAGLTATSNSVGVSLNGNPSLQATFNASPASGLAPSDTSTYTLNVQNDGAANATGVEVAASVPAHTSFVSSPTGTFDAVGNRVLFNVGTLNSAASTSVNFVVRVDRPLDSGNTSLVSSATLSASNAAQQVLTATATASASPDLFISNDAPASVPLPSAVLTAASSGTTLFVDRSDRFTLGQRVQVGNDVATIVAIGPRTLTVDWPISASSGAAVLGSVTLTIAYRNDGDADAAAVTVREALPAGLVYYDAQPSATSSPIAGNSGDVDWSIGTLSAGAGGTLRVIAFPSGSTGSFTSVATVAASNATTRTANAVTAIGGLSVTKTTSTPVLSAGDEASYTIVTSNSLASGVLVDVTDVLPQGFTYQDNSAVVGGMALEPTFDASDTDHVRPIWGGLQVPATGSLTITFKADIDASVGAAAYQNELQISAPASVAVLGFDPLASTREDVTVLAAGDGVVRGYVFRRFGTGNAAYDVASDAPLAGVRVEIHKPVYDCAMGTDCYVVYTDSAGYFERIAAAGDWIVSVIAGSGDLDAGWTQVAGSNDNTVSVPAQASVTDQNGFRALGAMHLVTAAAGTGGTINPGSNSVQDGDTTSFTVTPAVGYTIDTVAGCGGSLTGDTFTTAPITSACTVNATFAVATYAVNSVAGAGGSIGPVSATVAHGATTAFSVAPSLGYRIAGVTGCAGTLNGGTYTTGAITGACTVSASFVLDSYLVTATAGSGGTIAPASASVSHGATTSFTITAASSHDIAAVTGCAGSLTGNTFTTGPVTGACAVSATFALKTYTITTLASNGGSISPPSSTVTHGNTASFSITPQVGHRVASVSGCAGTLVGTTYTTQPVTADCVITAAFTSSGPAIATPPPARIDARSLFTLVPQSLAPAANDGNGASLEVTLVGGPLQLMPGRHILTWRAQDANGNTVSVEQQLDIWPMVSLGPDLVLDYGAHSSFVALLSGQAPQYPYTIEFTVGGDGGYGAKHTLANGFITFESGTESSIAFDTLPQGTAPPDHRLTVTLDAAENIGAKGTLDILMRATNFAPAVQLVASQADRIGTLIAKDGGRVTLHAVVDDANPADSHTFQWSYPTGSFVEISPEGFDLSFDPQQLSAGLLNFGVVATDSGNPPLNGLTSLALALKAASPVLGSGDANGNGITDAVEGWSDSGNGIPAYLNRLQVRNVLPENAPVADRYLIESEPSIRLRVGAAAQHSGDGGARLGSGAVPTLITADETDNVGGFFSFEAHDLQASGDEVKFIVPQRAPIPVQPSYRLWDERARRWNAFAQDAHNKLESAPGEPGYCPPVDSTVYTGGLTPGHLCVRITVQDGGVNDLDGQADRKIFSTGGVGTPRPVVVVTGTSEGSGGGGSMDMVWMMTIGAMALLRRRRKALAALMLSVLSPMMASAAETSVDAPDQRRGWLVGASVLGVFGSVDAKEMDARIAQQGYRTHTTLRGQQRIGGMVFGGYRWRHLGLEAAYVDLGRMTTRIEGTTPISEDYLLAIGRSHPQSGAGPQFSVLGYLPLNERFEVTGRIGTIYWRSNMSAQTQRQYRAVADRAFDPAFGLGLNVRLTDRWTAGAHWIGYRLAGERIDALSLGLSYGYRRQEQ